MNGLRERAIVVTGAASGIGEATCERLAAEGAWVGLLDRDTERLSTVVARLSARGARAVALAADVSREDQVRAALDGAVAAFGRLGGVVTCAGIFRPGDRQLAADVD